MQTTKKKPSLIFILVGAVLSGYLGYLINGAWTEGIAFNDFMNRFNEVCAVPFANYYNSNTVNAENILLDSIDYTNNNEVIEVALFYQYLSEKDNKFLENNNYTKEEVLSGFKQLLMKSGYSDLLYLLK